MEKNKVKKHVLKIIIPIFIIVAIGGIWFAKNADKSSKITEDNSEKVPATTQSNPDFALHVTEELDIEKLKSYGLPIIIDFGADACAPCKEMAPVLEKLNEELQGKVIIKFVDVWKYPELVQDYPVTLIPTQVFIDQEGNPYKPTDPQGSQMNTYSDKDTNEHIFTTHEGGMTEEAMLEVLKEMGFEE